VVISSTKGHVYFKCPDKCGVIVPQDKIVVVSMRKGTRVQHHAQPANHVHIKEMGSKGLFRLAAATVRGQLSSTSE
jgi:ribosomal protein S26